MTRPASGCASRPPQLRHRALRLAHLAAGRESLLVARRAAPRRSARPAEPPPPVDDDFGGARRLAGVRAEGSAAGGAGARRGRPGAARGLLRERRERNDIGIGVRIGIGIGIGIGITCPAGWRLAPRASSARGDDSGVGSRRRHPLARWSASEVTWRCSAGRRAWASPTTVLRPVHGESLSQRRPGARDLETAAELLSLFSPRRGRFPVRVFARRRGAPFFLLARDPFGTRI